jgi:hypothetical protein
MNRATTGFRGSDLDGWLAGEPVLDDACLLLLGAYRDASDAARETSAPQQAGDAGSPVRPQGPPAVPRLSAITGVEETQLGGLHGRLLAAGYLTADVLGRGEGLSYRVTREGLRRLAGEPAESEAA